MAHKRKYEVVAVTGKYAGADGAEKNRYHQMGVVLENERGSLSIKLESIPVGWDGWAYLNDPKPREDGQTPRNAPRKPAQAPDDSDVPF